MTGDEFDRTTWHGRPTMFPGPDGRLTFPIPSLPPYPRRDGRPLRGWDRLRFRWRLLALGYLTVPTFQRTMVWKYRVEVLVDGLPGPQTWHAYWTLRRRLLG